MNKGLKSLFLFAVAVLAVGAFFFATAGNPNSKDQPPATLPEAPTIGFIAPNFSLKNTEGRRVELAYYRGKNPIFLNFWASWCPACRQEAPQNEGLYRQLGPKGLCS